MWMTSASELFHSRRYRFGLRHNAVDVSGLVSSLAEANSSSSHQHRTSNRRQIHHYSSQNNRREYRHDLDACDPASLRIHRRRFNDPEHEAFHPGRGRSQSPTGSIINSDDLRSIQRRRGSGSDRLPGSVLLARERLMERLRGVSVSGNRQTRSDNNLVMEVRGEWQEEMASSSQETRRKQHPRGLDSVGLNWLQLQLSVLRNDGKGDESLRECTVCLEGFEDGDKVIRLHCSHTFHSRCLFPWVRVCGACPNCRKAIVVNV